MSFFTRNKNEDEIKNKSEDEEDEEDSDEDEEDSEEYDFEVDCDNCGIETEYSIPYGTLAATFLLGEKCENCGCLIKNVNVQDIK